MTLRIETRGSGRPVIVLPSFSLDHAAMAEPVDPSFRDTLGWKRLYVNLPSTGGLRPVSRIRTRSSTMSSTQSEPSWAIRVSSTPV